MTHTRTSFTIPIHSTLGVIILITSIITTLAIITTIAIILLTTRVLEARDLTAVVGAEEDPKVAVGAEDVES